jgi:hypothetical protein
VRTLIDLDAENEHLRSELARLRTTNASREHAAS